MFAAVSTQSSRPIAAPASARVATNMAFHSVRTLSSSPGRTRWVRAAKRAWRAASTSGGRSRSPRNGRWRMLEPSKLPDFVTPYHPIAAVAPAASISSGRQT